MRGRRWQWHNKLLKTGMASATTTPMAGHKLELEDDVSGVQWQCQKKMLETGVASATTTPVAGHKFEFEDNDVSGIK